MHYLYLGDDYHAKDAKINELKKTFFPKKEAVDFDCETVHASQLTSEDLKKSLDALPVLAPRRLLIIRESQKLKKDQQNTLVKFFESGFDKTSVLLDFEELSEKDAFFKKIKNDVKISRFGLKEEINVFDLTKCIGARRSGDALKTLDVLLREGIHPLQIMGGLVWFWGRNRRRVSKKVFHDGLKILQDTDLNIKRSRLKPEYALEVCVVKLCTPG